MRSKKSLKNSNALVVNQHDAFLTEPDVSCYLSTFLDGLDLAGKRVLMIVPDGTRTMPLPMMFKILSGYLDGVVKQLDFMVALGTHPAMNAKQLSTLFGRPVVNGRIDGSKIFNHAWDDPNALVEIGIISGEALSDLSDGRLAQPVPVRINRRIYDYDQLIICGPVFPHEVVGFSGGNKYFFPGIAGPEIIDVTHWLGAILTNYAVIGSGYTPVRAVIDRAAQFIDLPKACLAFVLDQEGIKGVFSGTPEKAWEGAAALSAQLHIQKTGRTFERVIAVMPKMYDDLWVGGKGMYKLEPVVADGGEVIIYAPHIDLVSASHGPVLKQVGYHVCDYFLQQWSEFEHYPWSVLAHATHVKGLGTYDAHTGRENPRIKVTLATGISRKVCEQINLNYLDPLLIDPSDWQDREDEGILVVQHAGEKLYRVK